MLAGVLLELVKVRLHRIAEELIDELEGGDVEVLAADLGQIEVGPAVVHEEAAIDGPGRQRNLVLAGHGCPGRRAGDTADEFTPRMHNSTSTTRIVPWVSGTSSGRACQPAALAKRRCLARTDVK